MRYLRLAVLLVPLVAAGPARAQTPGVEALQRMSLDDLLQVELTTATRTPEVPARSPVAVTVITNEDIRRSGATSLAEVLRLAPGVHVAQVDGNKWAVGIRGFTDRLSRAMLVMIDGRTVYTPLFAGTYWEMQDTLLDDIERIEVVRGPGGTLWGANATTGIINIITRGASATQGALVTASAGNVERGAVNGRYGGRIGAHGFYRLYGKWFDRGPGSHRDNAGVDGWQMGQGGFRADWAPTPDRTFTLQGDAYGGDAGQRLVATTYTAPFSQVLHDDVSLSGLNLLGRWTAGSRGGANVTLQAYYDRTRRVEALFRETRDTVDVDFQQALAPRGRQQLLWGVGYRRSADDTSAVPIREFTPASRALHLFSAFGQDQITLRPERLALVVGARVEHNSYSGVEVQPSARLLWTPSAAQTVVLSATRAVRTPSRVERDYTTGSLLNAAVPMFARLEPNPAFETEHLRGYEASYRVRPASQIFLTAGAFFNHHQDVLSTAVGTPFAETSVGPPRLIVPVQFGNDLHGNSHGVEVTADMRPTRWWRWTASYSGLRVQLTRDPGGIDGSQENRGEGGSPNHQAQVHSSVDLPGNVEMDWHFRYVSRLRAFAVPAYATSDLRVAWHLSRRFTLEVVGKNLHRATHLEFTGGASGDVSIRRGAYTRLVWRP
jgi:iron complex outermembrane receptor protein